MFNDFFEKSFEIILSTKHFSAATSATWATSAVKTFKEQLIEIDNLSDVQKKLQSILCNRPTCLRLIEKEPNKERKSHSNGFDSNRNEANGLLCKVLPIALTFPMKVDFKMVDFESDFDNKWLSSVVCCAIGYL